jgi:hypothetical protein
MDDGTILPEQSAVGMVYGAYASVTDANMYGYGANVGWFYVTDIWAWSDTPSQ